MSRPTNEVLSNPNYADDEYPINPNLCRKCKYGSKNGNSGYCNYILITHTAKSKIVDRDHCNEYTPGSQESRIAETKNKWAGNIFTN